MNKTIFLCLLTICCYLNSALADQKKLKIFTGIIPIGVLVEKVGTDEVSVESLVGAGFDPHIYEPTPKQIRKLSEADIYINSHMPFEEKLTSSIQTINPDILIVNISNSKKISDKHGHGHHDHSHHGHSHHDPHLWTSPRTAKLIAKKIYEGLAKLKPEKKFKFFNNYSSLKKEFHNLDQRIKSNLSKIKNKTFLVFHPAWSYFAKDYSLNQLSIEVDGKEPSAKSLNKIINVAKRKKIKIIFVQPQMNEKYAEKIASAIGAEVYEADPLAKNYPENLEKLSEVLGKELAYEK